MAIGVGAIGVGTIGVGAIGVSSIEMGLAVVVGVVVEGGVSSRVNVWHLGLLSLGDHLRVVAAVEEVVEGVTKKDVLLHLGGLFGGDAGKSQSEEKLESKKRNGRQRTKGHKAES